MNQSVILDHAEVLTALGDLRETTNALLAGASGIRSGPCFGIPVAHAPFADASLRSLDAAIARLARGIPVNDLDPARTLLVCCFAKGDIGALDDIDAAASAPAVPPCLGPQAEVTARLLGIPFGRTITVSSACTSGLAGLEIARELLIERLFTHAIVVGFEALSHFVVAGFHALGALSRDGARPFDARRDGMTPGEAAAIALLSLREPRVGDIEIAGAGSANDANHRTGPSRTGDGLHRAACAALTDAHLDPAAIGAVKCHGTATAYNDAMEAKAVSRLFGDSIPPCCSFKGALGHTSGGGALAEAALAAECLRRRVLPPTARFDTRGVDEPLPLSAASQPIDKPHLLCLAAGFGGINGAVVLREVGGNPESRIQNPEAGMKTGGRDDVTWCAVPQTKRPSDPCQSVQSVRTCTEFDRSVRVPFWCALTDSSRQNAPLIRVNPSNP